MQKAIAAHLIPSELGTPFEGGYFNGLYLENGQERASIIAGPEGILKGIWLPDYKSVPGARSFTDSLANTIAMAEAGSELAQEALALRIGGKDDWGIAAFFILDMAYRNFKPTVQKNYCGWLDGVNPVSVPPQLLYTPDFPAQTRIEAFREGGKLALPAKWIVSSTESSEDDAYGQTFHNGCQGLNGKGYEGFAVAVRSVAVAH
ncbi:DUF1566 domain-containing protein [Paludibacterium purpuratum]|uniref:DUF1566 domain-containing protein n=1 Tax=Paludibacterium purpuratum TaxID=1144873 RepID=A0A4R7BEQ5_9NEIS|nr:DUF1566 domain-containing protein [Paludibacterium purpuratum]TDR82157.1 hypothetical protein DFP86_102271 [Paludibacterium purpuratum]